MTEITDAWPGSMWADSEWRKELLDRLNVACQTRTDLEKSGSASLAEWAWGALCPEDVPVRIRHEALKRAGYPFRQQEIA